MARAIRFSGGLLLTLALSLAAQGGYHYYDPARQLTLSGKVTAIATEPMYQGGSPFLILTVATEQGPVRVEVAPRWFFQLELAAGMTVRVTGSPAGDDATGSWVIARELVTMGRRIELRDPQGFPLWRRQGARRGAAENIGGNCRGRRGGR